VQVVEVVVDFLPTGNLLDQEAQVVVVTVVTETVALAVVERQILAEAAAGQEVHSLPRTQGLEVLALLLFPSQRQAIQEPQQVHQLLQQAVQILLLDLILAGVIQHESFRLCAKYC
jgi:hypothetical protein